MAMHDVAARIAEADDAINREDFDALMRCYAPDATLVVLPGREVSGHDALRKAFVAIAEHFNHTLRVSQEEVVVVEGADVALALARTRVQATLKTGEAIDEVRRATYVFKRVDGRWLCAVDNSYGTTLLHFPSP